MIRTTLIDRNEKIYLENLMKLADSQEGPKAFLEKRPPKWQHDTGEKSV